MSSMLSDSGSSGRAERKFREAFERLKQGKPQRLEKGVKLTQNNVAKEAGVVPSGLRRTRFPLLADEIEAWIAEYGQAESQQSSRQRLLAQRGRNRGLRGRIEEVESQRDDALGKLVCAERRIVELSLENERLTAQNPPANVSPLGPTGMPKRGVGPPKLAD